MQFTDSHCHLDDIAFSEQLPALLAQCQQLAINRIIVPSIAPDNFTQVLNLAKRCRDNLSNITNTNPIKIYPCLGIHPWFLQALNDSHLQTLSELVIKSRNEIIAVGEIGIDGAIAKQAVNHGQTPEDNLHHQQHFFDFQLNLAKQQNLPVIIHHRQSHDKIMPFLKKYQLERKGIIHGFSGSYQQAMGYIDLGFKLGVGSTITYSRAKKTINTLKRLPLESLALETDAPSMPLSREVTGEEVLTNNEGTEQEKLETVVSSPTNSPVNLIKIFEVLSTIRPESSEEIANQLEHNINQIFFT
ncbi:TatD family hydrolase [Colwellia psychrerythraea]|uniref:Hydrolase, TatD family n=1 Tax=Colwellia psychrerythraea (strain 34H / ATCC BAA-681) TaxID=167879 RepID=Q487B2_COLP3|nr:TatD family hydrolase [Colwellia psychrerythraea]AAZ27843.1 hydrolase, TatD family [Colwellia psychrerythraea 34H]